MPHTLQSRPAAELQDASHLNTTIRHSRKKHRGSSVRGNKTECVDEQKNTGTSGRHSRALVDPKKMSTSVLTIDLLMELSPKDLIKDMGDENGLNLRKLVVYLTRKKCQGDLFSAAACYSLRAGGIHLAEFFRLFYNASSYLIALDLCRIPDIVSAGDALSFEYTFQTVSHSYASLLFDSSLEAKYTFFSTKLLNKACDNYTLLMHDKSSSRRERLFTQKLTNDVYFRMVNAFVLSMLPGMFIANDFNVMHCSPDAAGSDWFKKRNEKIVWSLSVLKRKIDRYTTRVIDDFSTHGFSL